jgi:hypothetical protein
MRYTGRSGASYFAVVPAGMLTTERNLQMVSRIQLRMLFGVILLAAASGWGLGVLTMPAPALASHSFSDQTWNDCGPYGCIGWKQFAVATYSSLPTAHMDNGGSGCGGPYDVAWAAAIVYWDGAGTVATFEFPRSDCTPVSYPGVRLIPYLTNQPSVFWLALAKNFDQNPSTGAFSNPYCLSYCSLGENSSIGAQYGYDLSEILFNTAKSPSSWDTVARHELGHVVGLADHHLDPFGCNSNYFGLMDDAGCDTTQLTTAEKNGVANVHDR